MSYGGRFVEEARGVAPWCHMLRLALRRPSWGRARLSALHLLLPTLMSPSLPVPTDNIYKFACLFGLALIVSAIFSFVAVYGSALDQKIKHSEVVISLEAKAARSKVEEDSLTLHRRLLDITKSNESFANVAISVALAIGGLLSLYGARKWHGDIQGRDDRLAALHIEKLEAEIAKLRSELPKGSEPQTQSPPKPL